MALTRHDFQQGFLFGMSLLEGNGVAGGQPGTTNQQGGEQGEQGEQRAVAGDGLPE